MRTQKHVWEKEHENNASIPSHGEQTPYSGAVYFVDFLKNRGIEKGNALDVGCGKGRNTLLLAARGFHVYAMDYIQTVLERTTFIAQQNEVQDYVNVLNAEIDSQWPFENAFFDVAIDCFSSIDVETLDGRITYRNEMFRTLKPGGFAFVAVVSADDELERKFITSNPGREKNTCYWPGTGKFQKDYAEQELLDFYAAFKKIELKTVEKPSFRLSQNYSAKNYWLIMQKP